MRDWKQEVRKRVEQANVAPERAAEIEEELSQHLRDRYQALRADGVDTLAAERTLLSELEEDLTQELRRVEAAYVPPVPLGGGGDGFFRSLVHDFRYGFRSLRLSPGFT